MFHTAGQHLYATEVIWSHSNNKKWSQTQNSLFPPNLKFIWRNKKQNILKLNWSIRFPTNYTWKLEHSWPSSLSQPLSQSEPSAGMSHHDGPLSSLSQPGVRGKTQWRSWVVVSGDVLQHWLMLICLPSVFWCVSIDGQGPRISTVQTQLCAQTPAPLLAPITHQLLTFTRRRINRRWQTTVTGGSRGHRR